MKNTQRGFGLILVLITLVIIALWATWSFGWFRGTKNSPSQKTSTKAIEQTKINNQIIETQGKAIQEELNNSAQ